MQRRRGMVLAGRGRGTARGSAAPGVGAGGGRAERLRRGIGFVHDRDRAAPRQSNRPATHSMHRRFTMQLDFAHRCRDVSTSQPRHPRRFFAARQHNRSKPTRLLLDPDFGGEALDARRAEEAGDARASAPARTRTSAGSAIGPPWQSTSTSLRTARAASCIACTRSPPRRASAPSSRRSIPSSSARRARRAHRRRPSPSVAPCPRRRRTGR